MVATAFLFPGQGSQSVGMGKALSAAFRQARDVFREVDSTLDQPLSRLMFEGPEAELTLTANAQPALMAVSIAVLRVLEAEGGLDLAAHAALLAGHSLGEYSAFCAAGALTLSDTARLLRLRGQAMQAAVPVGEGAMAALIGAEIELAEAIAAEAGAGEICDVANDNGGGQIVLSGHRGAIDRAIVLAKARGIRRAVVLPVSAPFHSRLMQPAADAMRAALASVGIDKPIVPVVTNVTAMPVSDPDAIRAGLVLQVTGRVRWRESMDHLGAQGIARFTELGAGRVLAGLAKRAFPDARSESIGLPEEIEAFSTG
jgi:[acyl-carrier-protein] S-malonyltransferase